MPGICNGTWINSLINNVDDGTIDVAEDGLGFLGGTHNNSHRGIIGVCIPGRTPHITFARFDGTSWFIYEGDIERRTIPRPRFVIVNGSVTTIFGKKTKKAPLADDWTAEKPT